MSHKVIEHTIYDSAGEVFAVVEGQVPDVVMVTLHGGAYATADMSLDVAKSLTRALAETVTKIANWGAGE